VIASGVYGMLLLHMFCLPFLITYRQDDHITVRISESFVACIIVEPLRRGDLLNAINKLAGERGSAKHPLLRCPPAITQG
jgi:hypothetical protein